MKALQVWLPALGPSLGHAFVRRDAHRAFAAWQGEHTVYLVPGLRERCRYAEADESGGEADESRGERQVLVIPAAHLDRLDVFHVGQNGYVWGPAAHERFPDRQVAGLLKGFLSEDFLQDVSLSVPGVVSQLKVPSVSDGHVQFEGGHVVYEYKPFFELGHVLPIEAIDKSGSFTLGWPPRGLGCPPIDPDAESCDSSHQRPDDLAGRACLRWGLPFKRLFTLTTGLDELVARIEMQEIMRLEDRDLALHRAREALSPFASEATTPVELIKFWPAYAQALQPNEPLRPFWEEFGVNARCLEEARSAGKLREPRRVLRVWGGLGLLWALLLGDLERGVHFCTRCGSPLRRQGRHCTLKDNPECFRAGRAAVRRAQRAQTSGARARIERITG
jgi:hypothetical protein